MARKESSMSRTTRVELRLGGREAKPISLAVADPLLAVRTIDRQPVNRTSLSRHARRMLDAFRMQARFPSAGVEVLRVEEGDKALRDRARRLLKQESMLEFAGRVLTHANTQHAPARYQDPWLYTENLFVQFEPDVTERQAKRWLTAHHLTIKRPVAYLTNAWFVAAPAGTGLDVFDLSQDLFERSGVRCSHPEFIRRKQYRAMAKPQWHLGPTTLRGIRIGDAHAHVKSAWRFATGAGVTIAVIDDGVDVNHPEFAGADKRVKPWYVDTGSSDPRPTGDNHHGTACAGVACAQGIGASGVAPDARLMPIRLMADVGSMLEADAIAGAAKRGADVISISWGPPDGDWWEPNDPLHTTPAPLPDHTRLAIEYATTQGRAGRGSVICYAAGNGNESVDFDGYASHPSVIAVAACNDRSKRSVYSDYGKAVWCAFPSNDFEDAPTHPKPLTPGIWTTDRRGPAGYNRGGAHAAGDRDGDYANNFGGTSSAAPGVAGVVALMLEANPTLTPIDVKRLLRETADRIDRRGGQYDASKHSPYYGYGRVNSLTAVKAARASRARRRKTRPR
jgi:subtilisin family serine protease